MTSPSIRRGVRNRQGRRRRGRGAVASLALACAIILGGLAAEARGQNPDRPALSSFRVNWNHRATSIGQAIVGSVSNTSTVRVTDVRLRVEGLNSAGNSVGVSFVWALGDIPPASETSFVAESIPGAADYRISVESFDLVSVNRSR